MNELDLMNEFLSKILKFRLWIVFGTKIVSSADVAIVG
jgi:hypothetical protein